MLKSIWTTKTLTELTLLKHHHGLPLGWGWGVGGGVGVSERFITDLKWIYRSVSSCNSILFQLFCVNTSVLGPLCDLQSITRMHFTVCVIFSECFSTCKETHLGAPVTHRGPRGGISLAVQNGPKLFRNTFRIYRLCSAHFCCALKCQCRLKD